MIYIRSQDKKRLCQVYNVVVDETADKLYLIRIDNRVMERLTNNLNIVATYKTKERAIEVLDEIQAMIAKQDLVAYTKQAITTQLAKGELGDAHLAKQLKGLIEKNPVVYEMPAE